jgi:TatA/E family protein of Tat protein translocase
MNLGMPEMIFIFLLALLIFGPKKLPQVGRELGKALTEFKRASNEFTNQLETEIAQVEANEQEKAVFTPVSTGYPSDPMAFPQPIQRETVEGETIEPRILPPSEPTVATTVGQTVEAEPSPAKPPAVDPVHDPNPAPLNLAAAQGENAGSINLNKAPLRESNA